MLKVSPVEENGEVRHQEKDFLRRCFHDLIAQQFFTIFSTDYFCRLH